MRLANQFQYLDRFDQTFPMAHGLSVCHDSTKELKIRWFLLTPYSFLVVQSGALDGPKKEEKKSD